MIHDFFLTFNEVVDYYVVIFVVAASEDSLVKEFLIVNGLLPQQEGQLDLMRFTRYDI